MYTCNITFNLMQYCINFLRNMFYFIIYKNNKKSKY